MPVQPCGRRDTDGVRRPNNTGHQDSNFLKLAMRLDLDRQQHSCTESVAERDSPLGKLGREGKGSAGVVLGERCHLIIVDGASAVHAI